MRIAITKPQGCYTWVQFLGRDDPLEKGMAIHSSILARGIPWTEEPVRLYSPWGRKESDLTKPSKTVMEIRIKANVRQNSV